MSKISCSKREVFLRSDFERLAKYRQTGKALRQLVSEGDLIKISHGLYAKARPNRITGEPMLSAKGGFTQVAEEALNRLKISWEPSAAMKRYQSGGAQVPVNTEVIIFGRFTRNISTGKHTLHYKIRHEERS